MVQNPGVTSRMMHYPPQPVKEEVLEGLGAHTVSWSGDDIRRTSF
jgi:hypothetical protein